MDTETRVEQQGQDVVAWRRDQLAHARYPLPLARRLANDPAFDLHALIELVERGCPPELAARILAPLEEASAA
jgi:hypothetical protein